MLIPALITLGIAILFSELVLWLFFERRIGGLHLHLASTTRKRIFTITRIRFLVLLHTVFLLAVTILSLLFLW